MVVGLVLFPVHVRLGGDTLCIHRHRDCRTIRNQTMTPKEKAEELIEKSLNMNDGLIKEFIPIPIEGARQCALVAVDEIIKKLVELSDGKFTYINDVQYYQKVKQELEKL